MTRTYTYSAFGIASLLLHVALLLFLLYFRPAPTSDSSASMTAPHSLPTRLLTPAELEKLRGRKGIVETETAHNDDASQIDRADYLGPHRVRVKEQTQGAKRGYALPYAPEKHVHSSPADSQAKKLARWGMSPGLSSLLTPASDAAPAEDQDTQNLGTQGSDFDSNDLKTGPQTLLNTDEFTFSSFFMHFRDELFYHWQEETNKYINALLQSHTEASYKTICRVYVGGEGEIKNIALETSSGDTRADQAAVQSLWKMKSFKNVPVELREGKQRGYFRVIFELSLTRQAAPISIDYGPYAR